MKERTAGKLFMGGGILFMLAAVIIALTRPSLDDSRWQPTAPAVTDAPSLGVENVAIDDGAIVFAEGMALPAPYEYRVLTSRVIDGDTVEARLDLGFGISINTNFRLRGINAPELRTDEGKVAKAFLESLLARGPPTVKVFKPDKYGDRWIAELWFNGVLLNEEMITSGHAVEYLK